MRPPSIPNESFERANLDLWSVKEWKKIYAVSVLAGLLTEPHLQANGIRLDWLQRIVLSKSDGKRKPRTKDLSTALNAGLDRAGVLKLEDPVEDQFCDLIATPHGNYRIFTGQWETAAPYTQTLLEAFESLPSGSPKRDALVSIYSLLKLSDELAARANVDRSTPPTGQPKHYMAVPSTEVLKRLVSRVRFSKTELGRLGIDMEALTPFLLEPAHFPFTSDREIGDTPLEFSPLLATPNGIIVASPANISLAVRAIMVRVAQSGGMDKTLLTALLIKQQRYSGASRFWPVPALELSPPNKYFLRTTICRFAEGRYLHVLQVPATFDGFPQLAFGSLRSLSEEACEVISDDVLRFWQFLKGQDDHRESITVLLLSGWGTPHSVAPKIDESKSPPNWRFLALSFADAAVLGACENGRLRDISRMLDQVDRLKAEGFSIQNLNGILNIFGIWRSTDGNLIPEQMQDIEPPCNLMIPNNYLLEPRLEAAENRDLRALPLPDGTFKLVQRINYDRDDLQPIYGSIEDAAQRRLLGAVFINERTWWIEVIGDADKSFERKYQVWHAVLQWLVAIGPNLIELSPLAFRTGAAKVIIQIPTDTEIERVDPKKDRMPDLSETITFTSGMNLESSVVQILPEWMAYLENPKNDAEVELLTAVLEQLADQQSPSVSRQKLREYVCQSINSRDWRWLHARQIVTPLDRLGSTGMVDRFNEVSMSALSLAKCGSVWEVRARSDGLNISGQDECNDFLARYRDQILDQLISDVRKFNREKLVSLAAKHYQAARLEQSSWHNTIRALRAIHGTTADADAFKRQNAINAVLRAAKSICEIGACEAPEGEALDPSDNDLDEMFARALLLFANGQIMASILTGLIKPVLKISPAGDLLSDRSIHEKILKPGAEWISARALNEAADNYGSHWATGEDEAVQEVLPWDKVLRDSIEAEYGVSAEAFVDLQFAVIQLAEKKERSVFSIKRSKLSDFLAGNKNYPSDDPSRLLDRLTLCRRASWTNRSSGLSVADIDLSRFGRPFSIINRPLVALDDDADPLLHVVPMFISDSTMYSLSGLMNGGLHDRYWISKEAKQYAGTRARVLGHKFEDSVAEKLRSLGLVAWPRCKLSWALNEKVPDALGDIDVLAISPDRRKVWVIEVKNLGLRRTEAEAASRLYEYRGQMVRDRRGREKPDKMLRHIQRVEYLRCRRGALLERLHLESPPEVKGLLIVDSPQPMNFYMLDELEDGESANLDSIESFNF